MTSPVSPDEAQAAVQAQLAQQAASAAGTPSAGVYGDPAGASQPSQATMDLSAARAVATDAAALLARIEELEAKQQAAADAANPAPEPPDDTLRADSNAPGWLHELVARIERRLGVLEGK